ncbi:ABC transporter ATP-binding protein [Brevibacterium casei]|uniref:ABC transporter ATP-binding protein n=1 Tax=Brevibacterium casei TaxID=33889 RepID=UPI00186BA91C|nr:ABC transporter ATP-binding protein [Brevibacterium casei]MBE4694165.1 ABC transporter ATP-binding protein [Brevibacterium casei]MBY3577288.1 ABC transporter ATP-binding protein [Brevibacterium casei]
MTTSPTRPTPSALRRTLRIITPHLGRHTWLIIAGLLALLADVVFRILEPWPIKIAVDAVTAALGANIDASFDIGSGVATTLAAAAIGLAVIVAGRAVTNYASTICFALVGARVATQLRTRVFDHIQALSLKYHSRASIGDTSQRLVGDIGRLQEVAVTAGLPLLGNIITLAVLLVVMVVLDPVLSAIVLATAVVYGVLSRVSTPKITTASRSTRKGEGRLVGSAAEALGAIRVVQAYGLERTVAADFADGNERALRAGVRARRLAAGLERSTDVLVGISQALVLAFGSYQVLRGAMTPGDLVLFLLYLKIAMKPLRDMAKYTGRIARATASGERIADLLDEPIEIADRPGAVAMGSVRGDVVFDGIRSRDGHGRPLFDGLDLLIPAGQRIGILGASGAGKSTLTSYLLRLAQPEKGRIYLDGYDTGNVTRASLRGSVSVLLQESVLFAATVRENIRYGRLDATDAEVEAAARAARADEFIRALPEGYDTVLGNRGDTLSGGQRQRLAIARALVRSAPVVVFDEASTGLDPRTRAQVTESLWALTEGRTGIVITHDVAMVRGLDRVVWLEDGRIVEDGSPQDLAADPTSRVAQWMSDQAEDTVSGGVSQEPVAEVAPVAEAAPVDAAADDAAADGASRTAVGMGAAR